jgi:hypothetical protein
VTRPTNSAPTSTRFVTISLVSIVAPQPRGLYLVEYLCII